MNSKRLHTWKTGAAMLLVGLAGGCMSATPGTKTHFQHGIESYDAGSYADAAHEFDLAWQEKKVDKRALFNLGLSYLKVGDFTNAAKIYEQYLTVEPDNGRAQVNLAHAYAGLNDEGRATSQFEAAIKTERTYAYPYCAYAQFWLAKNTDAGNQRAKELLDTACDMERRDSNARYLHGVVMQRLHDDTPARQDFTDAVEFDNNNQPALVQLGNYEVATGENNGAAKHFSHAAVLNAADVEAWLGAGRAYRKDGNVVLGFRALLKAKDVAPTDARVDRELALAALQLTVERADGVVHGMAGESLSAAERSRLEAELKQLQELQPGWEQALGR